MIDIDHFKTINDRHGHSAGDAVLTAIGRFIQSSLNPADCAFRWGGEEFLVLKPAVELGQAYLWADELRRRLSALNIPLDTQAPELRVTVSIGVESVPANELEHSVIERADQALYLAKRSGRNQVRTWPMVAVQNAVKEAEQLQGAHVAARRSLFLQLCAPNLGEIQKWHVTQHCDSVARLARAMGFQLGLGDAQREQVHLAGLFHDIGKCMVPPDLLGKSGDLALVEWDVIGRAPTEGAKLSLRLGTDMATAEAVRRHRTAYSRLRLRGEHLGEGASASSIVQVADTYIAMTEDRPYRARMSPDTARAQLSRQRGDQLDPAAVDALNSVLGAYPGMAA
jgi:diguanylate cyclase (GGDEF)-like protein/putative nucleotidyltransferase with HDIG domain